MVLEDLGSTNGTYLNGEPLRGPQPLHAGDRIRIGDSEFSFERVKMLRIADQWYGSDLGLQRQGNEDSYFVRAPLFVVADGMGGAQAGEVASEMAVDSFTHGLPDGESVADGLVHVIEEANRRIHERSRTQTQRAGMGTTVTAAHVGEDTVTVAHVGDSRAYVVRDGELIRITRDHSLVAELVERGKLTEEQAETHPQRSVITRALGPEPSVQVDVFEYPAKAGDVFMVCSDGLTSMVREPALKPLMVGIEKPLEELGRSLIAAANEAGGRDNITVILFSLEEIDAPAGAAPAVAAEAAVEHRRRRHERVRHVLRRGRRRARARASAARRGRPSTGPRAPWRSPRCVHARGRSRRATPTRRRGAPPRRRRRRLITPGRLLTLGCVIGLLAAFWLATRQIYFVGVDESRGDVVTLYQGLPYDLPAGIRLYSPVQASGVTFQSVPARRKATFTDHKLRSKDDATSLLLALERGQLN